MRATTAGLGGLCAGLTIGVLAATPAAAADDEVIDEVVTTARYIASTIGKSPAPLIETPYNIRQARAAGGRAL